ncbi:MAG: type II toxin-antitoxin system RelE/ParE family toxin [Chloroflexota bacterium]
MWVLKNESFVAFMKKNKITDSAMRKAASQIEQTASARGRPRDGLGGHIFVQNVARPKQGASRGYRACYTFKIRELIIFMYGYARRDRNRISDRELEALQALARIYLGFDEAELQHAIQSEELIEIA